MTTISAWEEIQNGEIVAYVNGMATFKLDETSLVVISNANLSIIKMINAASGRDKEYAVKLYNWQREVAEKNTYPFVKGEFNYKGRYLKVISYREYKNNEAGYSKIKETYNAENKTIMVITK